MKIKEYLRRAYRLNEKIDSELRELEQTNSILYNISASYDGDRVQTSMTADKIPNAIARLVELKDLIDREVDAFVDLKVEIRELIEKLTNPDELLIMRMRYIEFLSWNDIREKLGYGDSEDEREKMFKIHGRALKKLNDIKFGVGNQENKVVNGSKKQ